MNWDHCSDLSNEEYSYLRNQAEICYKNNTDMRLKYKCDWYTCQELFEYATKQSSLSALDIFNCIIMNVKKKN